jgi:hypothetical protein
MKKWIAGVVVIVVFLISTFGMAGARSLELKSKSADYLVEIKLDRNPPILGDNEMEMVIRDVKNGQVLKGLDVSVNYYMPPMPRMAPMNYTIPARVHKDVYRVKMNFIMSGPWVIGVKIPVGARKRTIKFNIDVQ